MIVKGKNFKMVIVMDEKLSPGLKCNTAAVLSLSLGKRLAGLIGLDLIDKSGIVHRGLTQHPIPILKCSYDQLRSIYNQVLEEKELLLIDVTDAAQTTKNYPDYTERLTTKENQELRLLGISISGDSKLVNKLTGTLTLV